MDTALIKKIETEKKFATAVYKNFMSLRYGLEPCCIIDMEAAVIDKNLCDWEDLKIKYKMRTIKNDIITCTTPSKHGGTTWTTADINALIQRIEILETTALEDEKDLSYVHDQPTATMFWIINHNLNKKPSVRIENLAKDDIFGEIDYVNDNTLRIEFAIPVAGTAYLN
jgi:hypothetical protein